MGCVDSMWFVRIRWVVEGFSVTVGLGKLVERRIGIKWAPWWKWEGKKRVDGTGG